MLFHPQSQLQEVHPAYEGQWSQHFMVVNAQLDGAPICLMNVYAPVNSRLL